MSVHIWLPWEDVLDLNAAWDWSFRHLLNLLKEYGQRLGGNAVVGLEVTADPYHERDGVKGLRLDAIGTAAKLEPLFGAEEEREWPKEHIAI